MHQHSNYSHILNILIDNNVPEEERNRILFAVYNLLNDTVLGKDLDDKVQLKWRVSNETQLHRYYTNAIGLLSDECVLRETKAILRDIGQNINKDNFKVMITRKQDNIY
jgi:hypothetical protein